jgi:hypothetical protein
MAALGHLAQPGMGNPCPSTGTPALVSAVQITATPARNRVAGRPTPRGNAKKVHLAHCANRLCTESHLCRRWCRRLADYRPATTPRHRSPDYTGHVPQASPSAPRAIPDLSDEPTPLAIHNVPGIRPTQLRSAQSGSDTAGFHLRPYLGHSPAITSRKYPHRHTYRRAFLALSSLHTKAGVARSSLLHGIVLQIS